MLMRMDELLKDAHEKHYGIVGVNIYSEAMIRWTFEVGQEKRSPIIIMSGRPDQMSYRQQADITRYYAQQFPEVPVALNLDHGRTLEQCIAAIGAGFTSIMLDKSRLPFEENVAALKEAVRLAHAAGVSVEGEIGHVGGHGTGDYEEEWERSITTVDEAVRYVEESGVDCLAVAVGTWHGSYCGHTPRMHFERAKELREAVKVPLVVHGGSYSGLDNLGELAKIGISKFNVRAELYDRGYDKLKEVLNNLPTDFDQGGGRNFNLSYEALRDGYKENFCEYIDALGSANRF